MAESVAGVVNNFLGKFVQSMVDTPGIRTIKTIYDVSERDIYQGVKFGQRGNICHMATWEFS